MLFISLCSDKEIEVVPFLIERWNAKKVAYYNKSKRNQNLSLQDMDNLQEKLQNNITNTLIHYFKNLEDTCNGIDFYSYPLEIDSTLHIKIEPNLESRNIVFNEIYKLVKEYKNLSIKQK